MEEVRYRGYTQTCTE